jgi:ankyrin repeat protein
MIHYDHIQELISLQDDDSRIKHLLLNYHPADDYPDEKGRTTIHHLAFRFSFDLIKILIDKNVNINLIDDMGNTPLHYAVFRDDYSEVLKYFIKNGARVNVKNKNGHTPCNLRNTLKQVECDAEINYLIVKQVFSLMGVDMYY